VVPASGPLSGLTNVTLVGGNFTVTNTSVVLFADGVHSVLVNATVLSSSLVSCISPPFAFGGAVSAYVELSLNGQQFTTDRSPFLYYSTRVCVSRALGLISARAQTTIL
jgi:hypothetical protein